MSAYRLRGKLHENFLEDMLLSRGIAKGDFGRFLQPDFAQDSHDPFLFPDMDKAVERILLALTNREKVSVWSDYDCDGIPGGVMLTDFLRTLGLEVRHYIPHRHKEGYGLNTEGIDELKAEGVTLIITIDLGTTEHEAVTYAKQNGIDIIVTDHHLVQDSAHLPDAVAVINPKRPDSQYPFDGLCGAGVAWKLVQAILQKKRPDNFSEGQEKWYLDLVGIATLSDMVPLVGENRMLAHFGLKVLRRARRPGLATLLQILKIKPETLTEDDIGFMIAPRINAASRMDNPRIAAEMLAAKEKEEGEELARKLNKINDERKGVVAAIVKEANKRLRDGEFADSKVIVMGNPKWRPGVLGLVASNLVEAEGKTVFLWGRDYEGMQEGGGVLRGSCRSSGSVNVVELMQAANEVFDHFGGHHASGGFSVNQEKIHELGLRLQEAYLTLPPHEAKDEAVLVEREVELEEVPFALKELDKLAPFGVGNTKPLFLFQNVVVTGGRVFGKTANHLELQFSKGNARVAGIAFFTTGETFTKKFAAGEKANVVGHIERDWKNQPRIRIVDLI